MTVLVVDDERLARNELRRLLTEVPDVEIVGEAANADEAQTLIDRHHPDAVFLDIQMPGRNVFDMLADMSSVPHVIFTTAYDQYALKAFDVNALDYLMKPIDPVRLAPAIEKLRTRIAPMSPRGHLDGASQVFVKDGEQCWFVTLKNIRLFESEGNYCRVHFDNKSPLILRSLNALEEKLDPTLFFRANRRQIINLSWIDKIDPWFDQSLQVTLTGPTLVTLSRRQATKFRNLKSL